MSTPARLRTRADHARAPLAPRPPAARRTGFVLYVSLPEEGADEAADGSDERRPSAADLAETADLLRELAQDVLPGAETFTALSLGPGSPDPTPPAGARAARLRLLGPVDAGGAPDVLSGSGDAG